MRVALFLALLSTTAVAQVSLHLGEQFNYQILVGDRVWFKSAETCVSVLHRMECASGGLRFVSQHDSNGADAIGEFVQHKYIWQTTTHQEFHTNFFVYADKETIRFQQHFPRRMGNVSMGDPNAIVSAFPSFRVEEYPELSRGYLGFHGPFMGSVGQKIEPWGNHTAHIGDGIPGTGPLAIFTTDQSTVISPASSFMSVNYHHNTTERTLSYGLMGRVEEIPAGHSMDVILSAPRGAGVNDAMENWGAKLLSMHGKKRGEAEADFTTNYLGYSTDNGAYYYYHTEPHKTYQQTMLDVKNHTDALGIPYKHWLMDSWWYFKGVGGGVKNWTAMPSVFPDGAEYLYQETTWPVVAHNRYWSSDTVYAKQNGGDWDFLVEGKMALPLEQGFWDSLMQTARKWGMKTYEQDWLYNQFLGVESILKSATLGRQWLMQMGTAAHNNGVTVQYCMSYPRHMLQSVEIQAVTQARASDDYQVARDQWKIGLTSLFGYSIAVTPTKDNFRSSTAPEIRSVDGENALAEPNARLHALVSTLSKGPVANSDKIGFFNKKLLMRSCASSGKLLRADRPATTMDKAIYSAAGILDDAPNGEVWTTFVRMSHLEYGFLLVAEAKAHNFVLNDVVRQDGRYIAWETNTTTHVQPVDNNKHTISVPSTTSLTFQFWVIAPVLPNGCVFMGEASTKWVPVSNDRFHDLSFNDESISVQVQGGPSEVVQVEVLCEYMSHPEVVPVTLDSQGAGRWYFELQSLSTVE